MTFKHLSEYFSKLEKTSLRNQMTEILASLFHEAERGEIGKLCYLLQGRVAPLFTAVEFGMADKMVIRAIVQGLVVDGGKVVSVFKSEGDLGNAVQKLKLSESGKRKEDKELGIVEVYDVLYQIATSNGTGSQEKKINLLGDLLKYSDPLSAKYIVRMTLAKLRLGFSDMTILDALSWMLTSSKSLRAEIEKAYNVRPDLGYIGSTIKTKGIKGLSHVIPMVGTPIMMARAERMTTGIDIIEKVGKCAVEPKYDGFRLQVHFDGKNVSLISRNLENVTAMYPDIVEGVKKQIKAKKTIFEGEAIGINVETGEYLPFQETVQRKRKYDIEAKAKEIPLKLFAFDCLFADGEEYLYKPYLMRRKKLEQLVEKGDTIYVAHKEIVADPKRLEEIFQDAVTRGLEGVMAKKLDGTYRAGARDFNWIKYKRSYAGKLSDTIDAVVMGYDLGQGKRSSFGIGDFLIGIYDKKKENYLTVAKIGTGLTDIEWQELQVRSQKLRTKVKPENYDVDKAMSCDVWMKPEIVVEIRADEITRSPVHTAGRVMGPSKSGSALEVKVAGFALRFPRLERFRGDKKPEDATNLSELETMYDLQIGNK
ncbi:MAG: ATP-dependent DNA ligase [Patescibacteria group bacterium]|nr:ATP-dependent DNA ligase [Patescibacteria group bacterium]